VRRAVIQVAHLGVDFLTVHASMAAMQAAAAGRNDSGLKLLAVTVLTSADDSDLRQDGYALSVADLVGLRVRNAMEARMDGLICSPLEVARVRTEVGAGPILVTPGVPVRGRRVGGPEARRHARRGRRQRRGLCRDRPTNHTRRRSAERDAPGNRGDWRQVAVIIPPHHFIA
jgi:orotidine-5'-phosphate decarboxylase